MKRIDFWNATQAVIYQRLHAPHGIVDHDARGWFILY